MNIEADIFLPSDIVPATNGTSGQEGTVLLSGGTGFLGAYVIVDLLTETSSDLFCLVRSEDTESGKARILENLEYYGLFKEEFRHRIHALPGDLAKPNLAIDKSTYEELSERVSTVYHLGASVNFEQTYHQIKPVNVDGLREILRFACNKATKPVHIVSTYAVFNSREYDHHEIVYEKPLQGTVKGINRGYGRSKWVVEKICAVAIDRGIPISIYRAGIISGDSHTGKYNPNDFTNRLIFSALQLGFALDEDFLLHLTPVEYCSRALVHLSIKAKPCGKIYHLVNEAPLSWSVLLDWLHQKGYEIDRLDFTNWLQQLKGTYKTNSYSYSLYLIGKSLRQKSFRNINICRLHYNCDNVKQGLTKTDIVCPPADGELLAMYMKFYLDALFLHPKLVKQRATSIL